MIDHAGYWKLITYLTRRVDADHAQFSEYWRSVHAPLVQQQPDFWRYVRRYVQNDAIDDSESPIDSPDRADGVSEFWFDTLEDLRQALNTSGYRNVIEPDLAKFVALDVSGSLVTEHVPIDDRPAAAIKLCAAAYRNQSLTREAAQRYWREEHPQVIESVGDYKRHVRRYIQNHPRAYDGPTIGRALDHDLALEIYFDTVAEMTEAFSESAYLAIIRTDELKFADVKGGLALVTQESILFDAIP